MAGQAELAGGVVLPQEADNAGPAVRVVAGRAAHDLDLAAAGVERDQRDLGKEPGAETPEARRAQAGGVEPVRAPGNVVLSGFADGVVVRQVAVLADPGPARDELGRPGSVVE